MFFKTDILQRYLHTYSTAKPKDLGSSCFDSEMEDGHNLSYNHFHTFNDKGMFVFGLCIIEKSYYYRTERTLRIDFNTIEIHNNRSRYIYVPGTSFFEFCQMHGMSPAESQLAYTLAKMVCIRIGTNVL